VLWMGLARSLRWFWREYRRDRVGVVGLVLLAVLVFIAVAFPLVGDSSVIANWNNYEYFKFYPKAVPPCWASMFTGKKYTKTVFEPGSSIVVAVDRGEDGLLHVWINASFPVTGDTPPNDVILVADMYYRGGPFYVDRFAVVRPDGSVVDIVSPGSRVPLGLVFGGVSSRSGNVSGLAVRLHSIVQNAFFVQRYVIPSLREQGFGVSFADAPIVSLNLFRALFSSDVGGVLAGSESSVLRGEYRWVVRVVGPGGSVFSFVPRRLVVSGSCYGVLGTDDRGHDLWQGFLYGVRWALIVGLVTSALSVFIGSVYGVVAGYFGGIVDEVLLRFAQIVYSLPMLPILILLAALYRPSIWLIVAALVVFSWQGTSFVTRAIALQVRQEPYVESAIALGAGTLRVIFLYVYPQVLPYVFASIALSVPSAIITEASLSFLGVGDPSVLTWGRILHEAEVRNAALNGYWWWVVPPGLGIALVGLTFIFIGSALDRLLNPRLKR